MKKRLFFAATPLLLFAQSAFAALPPLWQGVREIEAILKDHQLKEHFSSADQIQEIVKGEDNTYTIRSNNRECIVHVIYQPMMHPGPAKFTLNFQAAEQSL